MAKEKKKQEFDNIQCLKEKLATICQKQRFCAICLETSDKLWSLNTEFDISVAHLNHTELLKDIIDFILNNESRQILASSYLCSHCTEKSIQSYLFIHNARKLSNIIFECVNELYSKTVDVQNQLPFLDCYQNANVVILLEQEHEMSKYIDIGKTTEIVAKETSRDDETTVQTAKLIKTEDKADNLQTEVLTEFHDGEKLYIVKEESTGSDTDTKYEEEDPLEINTVNSQFKTSSIKKNKQLMSIFPAKKEVCKENFKLTCSRDNFHPSDTDIDSSYSEKNIDLANTKKNTEAIPPFTIDMEDRASNEDMEITYLDEDFLSSEIDPDKENSQRQTEDTIPKKKKKGIPILTYKCPSCRKVLPSNKRYKDHIKICKKQKIDPRKFIFTCKICDDKFLTQRSLNTHYKTHSKVTCKVCQFIVAEDDLQEHVKINHEEYAHFCKLCTFFCPTAERLKVHTEKKHCGPQCALCFKKVKENDLKTHRCKFNCWDCLDNVCIHYKYLVSYKEQVQNNVTKIKCVDCDYACPRKEALLGHANREHLDHHPFTCDYCQQQFYSRISLRHHINKFHREKCVCEYCDQEFTSKTNFENHRKLCQCTERNYKCDDCPTSFDTLEELAKHVKLRHNKGSFSCNLCEKKFLNSVKRHEHMFRVHSGVQMKIKRSVLTCPICDERCDSKRQLLQHVEVHGPNAKFPCKECDEEFGCIRKLLAHIRAHNADVIQCVDCKKVLTKTLFPHHMMYCNVGRETKELCTCEICGKTCTNEIQLKFHKKIHLERVPCPICEKPTKPVYMNIHIKRLHSKPRNRKIPKPRYLKNIACEWCGHLVARLVELETHVNRFHLKVKPYQCNYCEKKFFGQERLKIHLITHTTAKTCYCTICGHKFENKKCLKLHMRRHTGVTPYTCEICGESFRTSSMMNTHKVKKHSERTVACPLCEGMFHLTRDMRSHFKKVHWKQKDKKFDPREVKELSPAFYHLFEDGRLSKVDGDDLLLAKCNEKYVLF